ncbi:MAG: hypothetical protein LBQ83_01145, partial [Candidatus Margulisbacteria bacterium]|nr:hypothetical protein [Candidatus Margulisiibacteriota bacterium]
MKKVILLFLLFGQGLGALTAGDLLRDSADNRARISSYQAEVVTTVESPLAGRRVQQGLAYYQYPDRSRTDSFQPRQTVLKLADRVYTGAAGRVEELKNEAALPAAFQQPESLLARFDFQLETAGQGWRLTGTPGSADPQDIFSSVYFTRLLLTLDENKNITELSLYDDLAQEALNIKTVYAAVSGIAFPVRTEVFLRAAGLTAVTEYKNIRLNIPLA